MLFSPKFLKKPKVWESIFKNTLISDHVVKLHHNRPQKQHAKMKKNVVNMTPFAYCRNGGHYLETDLACSG